ncbi:MAG: adenylosuccinate synthetase, partial [Gammaproteobacteria bacterium]
REIDVPPLGADRFEKCTPVFIEMPGWSASTVGVKSVDQLPQGARDYLAKVEALCGVPVDIISTGPDREETIIKRHPFE